MVLGVLAVARGLGGARVIGGGTVQVVLGSGAAQVSLCHVVVQFPFIKTADQ